jgi:hypothetical protein
VIGAPGGRNMACPTAASELCPAFVEPSRHRLRLPSAKLNEKLSFSRQAGRMSRLAKLQLIGPAVLFAALLGADSAAYALATFPSSSILWRINLELFGIFQKADEVLRGHVDIAYFQLLFVGLPLAIIAGGGVVFRRRLLLAAASNLSFVYAAFLLCSWYVSEHSWRQTSLTMASLVTTSSMTTGVSSDLCVAAILLVASLLSLVVSHMSYLRACLAERDVVAVLSVSIDSGARRGRAAAGRLD